MAERILLWGAKSQARIVFAELSRQGKTPQLLFDRTLERPAFQTAAKFLNSLQDLRDCLPSCSHFVVCIGGKHGAQRAEVSRLLRDKWGLQPLSVISSRAVVDPDAVIGEGAQIMAGACIGLAAEVGEFCLVNTNATVDHETRLGKGVHVMGAAAVAGRVIVHDFATIGTNATVIPDLTIGSGAQIGAGALIRHDVPQNAVMVGVPAKLLRLEEPEIDLTLLN